MLPESERIYYKDFHFLDEPLIDRQNKRDEIAAEKSAAETKALTTAQQPSAASDAPSVSTVAGSSTVVSKGTVVGASKI